MMNHKINHDYDKALSKALIERDLKNVKTLLREISKKQVTIYQCKYCGRFSINKNTWFKIGSKTYYTQIKNHIIKILKKYCVKHIKGLFNEKCKQLISNISIHPNISSISYAKHTKHDNEDLKKHVLISYIIEHKNRINNHDHIKNKHTKEGAKTKRTKIETQINFNIRLTTCNDCRLERSSYYEAIIQLRATSVEALKQMEGKVKNILKQKSTSISKIERYKNGVDLYVNKSRTALSIGRLFKNHIVKTSKKFVSVKDGKRKYRVTVLIREGK